MKDFKVYQTSGMLNFLVSEASDVRKKEQTLSGDIVSFTADAQTPAKIVVDIDSTGWTGCEVWNDPKYGGLINFNQMAREFSDDYWQIEQDITVSYADGVAEIYNPNANSNGIMTRLQKQFVRDHKYVIYCEVQSPTVIGGNYGRIGGASGTSVLANFSIDVVDTWIPVKTYEICTSTIASRIYTYITSVAYTLKARKLCVFDLTEIFGAGNEPASVEEFEALFPEDYYPYNTGTETTVSAVNGDPYFHLSVAFPDEVGTVTDGTLTIDYDGSVTLITGGQKYTLTSVSPIETYIGDNNIWADTGDVSVTYPI